MIYAGIDTETTGLQIGEHRIIEVYCGLWKDDKLIASINQRINPGRSISIESQRVHGITFADVSSCPVWEDVAPKLHKFLSSADVIIAHNGKEFDMPFINHEFERVGLNRINKPIVDTMLEGRWAKPDGTIPNLGALCFACGVEYDTSSAHAASYDVEVMMECFFKAKEWGFIQITEK